MVKNTRGTPPPLLQDIKLTNSEGKPIGAVRFQPKPISYPTPKAKNTEAILLPSDNKQRYNPDLHL
jgi:hypothetical protein